MKTLKITSNRKVKYRVTDNAFGLECKVGEIREAFIVASDGTFSLLYHPRGKVPHECACFEFCRKVGRVYEGRNNETFGDGDYVNVTTRKDVTVKEI